MKKLIFSFLMLFTVGLFATNDTNSSDLLIFVRADGTFASYDDGCDRLTFVWDDGTVWNEEGAC